VSAGALMAARPPSPAAGKPDTRERARRRWRYPLALVLMGVAAFVSWRARSEGSAPEALEWAPVGSRSMASTVVTSGTVRLRTGAQVRVGSQISGVVRRLLVGVGSRVEKGELIAEIDTRAGEARMSQMRAQLQVDQVGLEKAQSDLVRSERLLRDQLVPAQQTQDLRFEVEQARARVAKSGSDLLAAKVDLDHAEIRTPIAGTVASVSTQEGETVASAFTTPTFVTIIDDRALELVAMVDETDIAEVRPGQTVTFTTEAYPARELPAVLRRVNPAATIISGVVNYEVVSSIEAVQDFLRPDMTANVSIVTSRHDTLVVPDTAVHRRGDGAVVYAEASGRPRETAVTTGAREGGFTEIKKGLHDGERVLIGAAPAREK
jgi:HlyD family secretion protein